MILPSAAKTVLYSAWFCPFAQRVWAALNELEFKYELVEALQIDPQTQSYIKDEGLVKNNPKGLVPTLVQEDEHGDKHVYCDSMEILKELFSLVQNKDEVMDLYKQAKEWNHRICSPFYTVIMQQDQKKSYDAWQHMLKNLAEFSQHLEYTGDTISFYKTQSSLGDVPCLVDFCVFPFVHRLGIIEYYKGLSLPASTEQERQVKNKIIAWQKRMEARPSVKQTLAERFELTPIYERYADGTAKSKVADFVRQGGHAHDV